MKILGSDFDRTLNYGGIGEEKITAIREWRRKGNKFGIVSGRGANFYNYLTNSYPELEFDFLVTCSGGYITDTDGAVIYDARCTDIPAKDFVTDLFDLGFTVVHVKTSGYYVVLKDIDCKPPYVYDSDVCLLEDFDAEYFNQISVQSPSVDEATEMAELLVKRYNGRLNPLQNGDFLDIVPAGVNKAQGLYRVMEHYGCKHSDVITVGDNRNDIDMLREFRSYAMESGVEAVKAIADGIVGDVTEIIKKEI